MSTVLRKRFLNIIAIVAFLGFLFNSCVNDGIISNKDAKLSFSLDTLMFDTIFTSIGSTTKSFRVINPNLQPIIIENIKLAGGDQSSYRLNIDGDMTNEKSDIKLMAKDSLYIFVEITVDPNGANQPMVIQDSIVFTMNSNMQDIDLMAWGQDFVPINNTIIETSTWTAEKPYLVYNIAWVDTNEVLTIEPGARIFFHKDASMYVLGSVKAIGTQEMPIVFSGDRLEEMYNDIADQWQGILLFPNEHVSEFENVEILNANTGLQVGTIEYEGSASARLHNVKIEHMGYAGIFALKSQIVASNVLVGDCGFYSIALLAGGFYDFTHCTVANYWGGTGYPPRKTSSVVISNQLLYDNVLYTGEQVSYWRNSIIWGNATDISEVEFSKDESTFFDFKFDNCIVKMDDSTYTSTPENFISVTIDKDPRFKDQSTYDYQLDTLSPAQDAGLIEYGEIVPFDLNNVSRLSDNAPDLGVYERIEGEDSEGE